MFSISNTILLSNSDVYETFLVFVRLSKWQFFHPYHYVKSISAAEKGNSSSQLPHRIHPDSHNQPVSPISTASSWQEPVSLSLLISYTHRYYPAQHYILTPIDNTSYLSYSLLTIGISNLYRINCLKYSVFPPIQTHFRLFVTP